MTDTPLTSCAVVPAYNEAAVLGSVIAGLAPVVDEIVCIDDGSADETALVARAAGATVVRHAVNLGQGAALQTGFSYVQGRTEHGLVVTFDSDGQHRPDDAARMLQVARRSGVDVVLGTRRRESDAVPPARRALLRAALWYSRRTTGLDLTDTHNGLRVLSRRSLAHLRITQPGMAHASELEHLIARHGLSWTEHEVDIDYTEYSRAKGQSGLNAVNIVYDLALARIQRPA